MIQVDIYIPSIEDVYDFIIDEGSSTENVIEDLIMIIRKKTGSDSIEGDSEFLLYRTDTGTQVDPEKTMAENGIADGMRLMLV